MSKILPLKKALPASPDQIQKFATEAEAAVARMAHLNRAALYIGNEIATDSVNYNSSQMLYMTKPCGLVEITNLGVAANGNTVFDLVFDYATYLEGSGGETPAFVQLTLAKYDSGKPMLGIKTIPLTNGVVKVEITNLDSVSGLDELSFFYTVIPQLS